MQAMDKVLTRIGFGALGLSLGASVVNSCIYDVDGGKMAVMFNRFPNPIAGEPAGIQRKVLVEGTHFKIPWLQDPKIFDVRTRPRAIPTVTGTKDLQVCSHT